MKKKNLINEDETSMSLNNNTTKIKSIMNIV